MLLEDVIRLHLSRLYRGYEILSSHAIRVTRDCRRATSTGRAEDLLRRSRRASASAALGDAVRLQV